MMRPFCFFALSMALAACGNDNSAEDTDAVPPSAPAYESLDMWAEARLVADPDGILAKGSPLFRFGTQRSEVEAMAASAYGQPDEQSRNNNCGTDSIEVSRYGPLRLGYQDERFVGWHLSEGKGAMLADGVPVGWPLKALRTEREVRDIDPAPGGEFTFVTRGYGQITGFADDDPAETITAFAAGMTCFFR